MILVFRVVLYLATPLEFADKQPPPVNANIPIFHALYPTSAEHGKDEAEHDKEVRGGARGLPPISVGLSAITIRQRTVKVRIVDRNSR